MAWKNILFNLVFVECFMTLESSSIKLKKFFVFYLLLVYFLLNEKPWGTSSKWSNSIIFASTSFLRTRHYAKCKASLYVSHPSFLLFWKCHNTEINLEWFRLTIFPRNSQYYNFGYNFTTTPKTLQLCSQRYNYAHKVKITLTTLQ